MQLKNKTYDMLKWVISLVLPALIVFLGTVFTVIEWEYAQAFLIIIGGLELFLGTIFKVSDYNYQK